LLIYSAIYCYHSYHYSVFDDFIFRDAKQQETYLPHLEAEKERIKLEKKNQKEIMKVGKND